MAEPPPATESPRSRDELVPGTRIARYTLIEAIGSGGIGIVYTAYDPDLDRRVALKLLRPSKLAGRRATIQQRRARLLREAQALARLSHPNVVPIYEVGTFGAQIYLVMEFIDGLTLGAWFRARARRWHEIVAVFLQAGRGLAAAHEAAIVHRDFKPDNVLVGHDGRVRVLDFGLAGPLRAQDSAEKIPVDIDSDSGDERSDEASDERFEPPAVVTRDGQVLGTPAYMAPEQSAGGHVDARSDQFGFCVALYEALYGQRPFRGRYDDPRRYVNLAKARTRGRLPGKRPSDLPGDIERILLRGLSLDPERRFPNMQALLDELEALAQPSRRWWWLPLGLVGIAAATVIGFMSATAREPELRGCDDGSNLLIGIWDGGVADELLGAAEQTSRASIVEMATNASKSLDEWASRWRKARLRACEAGSTYSAPSDELLEQRLACLDRQLVRVDSTLAGLRRLFAERPESLADRLDAIGDDLPDPHDCEAAPLLERKHLRPRDPALASTIAALEDELAMVEGRFDGDKDYEAAHRAGKALLARARATQFDPLIAEVLLLVGQIDDERSQENPEDAEQRLSDAAWTAQRAGHDEVLVTAAAKLVEVLARTGRFESARLWAQLGRATLARLGDDTPAEAELQLALAELETAEGDFEGALAEREPAIELLQRLDRTHHRSYLRAELAQANDLRELGRYDDAATLLERNRQLVIEVHGANHPRVAEVIEALGMLRSAQGQQDEALRLSREALALVERVHGEDSAEVAKVLNNLAIVLDQSGRYGEAVEVLERARTIFSRVEGERSRAVAYVDVNLGQALHNLGRYDEAATRYESALGVLIELFGEAHPAVVITRLNLAVTRTHGRDVESALEQLEAGRVQLEGLLGPDHPDLAELEHERARALRELGRLDAAKTADQRALALLEQAFGAAHARLVLPLTGLAETELALGHVDEALTLVGRLEPLLDDGETPPIAIAQAKFVIGRVLVGADGTRERERGQRLIGEARALAERTEGGRELLLRINGAFD
jgi:tetratricopeptide (TPR) repeat protein/tRNA A-37 threonylcarbamoyl transferase component Bud32